MTGLETALAGVAIKESVGPAKSLIARLGRPGFERLVAEYCQCFQAHVDSAEERCRYVKNVLYRDNAVELLKQYVHVSFDRSSQRVEDSEISKIVQSGGRVLISGTAGAGKTMFMKWLTLDLIKRLPTHQKIPLFLELRYIEENSLKDGFLRFILDSTSKAEGRVSIDRFKAGFELGQFILILDAVDEVRPDLRTKILSEIRLFLKDYPLCSTLLSSRPDEELESIQDLTVYRTCSMNRLQITEVIEKLEFDTEVKGRLIERLQDGLFTEHEEFLSNPLLATIMLLNFDHSADIPTRLTAFYRQAFEALYQRHDAAKGAYRRGHYAGLPLDEYEKIFSAFCFDSFLDSKVQFSDSEILDYFRAAADYCQVQVGPLLLVQDAMKSICVIQREGLDNTFAHRSFQEYFAALFLSRYREDDFAEQIESAAFNWQSNNVLRMLLEISPETLEQEWLKPKIEPIVKAIRRLRPVTLSGSKKMLSIMFSTIRVEIGDGSVVGFSGQTSPKKQHAGNWLSELGASYTPPLRLSRVVFDHGSLFTSLEEYLARSDRYPMLADLQHRIELTGDNDERRPVLEIGPEDMEWLMESRLPEILGNIQKTVIEFYNQLSTRIDSRAKAMARLRTRHFRRPAL